MANIEPSFADRCERMAEIARQLVHISDEIHDESQRMAAAQARYSERRGRTTKKASR